MLHLLTWFILWRKISQYEEKMQKWRNFFIKDYKINVQVAFITLLLLEANLKALYKEKRNKKFFRLF